MTRIISGMRAGSRLLFVGVLVCLGFSALHASAQAHNGIIDHPEKIGIGAAKPFPSLDANDIDLVGANWYYNWTPGRFNDYAGAESEFIPTIWNGANVNASGFIAIAASGASEVLGFNEPDNPTQSNMSVAEAISLWPQIEAAADSLNLRIGSPATADSALGPWQVDFMDQVWANGYRVDFMVVHWYNGFGGNVSGIDEFRIFLENVFLYYGLPIWVKEWGLVDFSDEGIYDEDIEASFSLEQSASYFLEAAHMMDDLDFVERHSWFQLWPDGQYAGLDGWQMYPVDYSGGLTQVGEAFKSLTANAGPNPNRLTNPGFELGLNTNWNGFGTSEVLTDPLTGSRTLVAPSDGGAFHQPVTLPAGSYVVTFDLRRDGESGPAFLGLDFNAPAAPSMVESFEPTDSWVEHTVAFEVDDETQITLWFWGSNGGQAGQYRVDNTSLSAAPACAADLNADGQADDDDAVVFIQNILDHTDEPSGTLFDLLAFLRTLDEGCVP